MPESIPIKRLPDFKWLECHLVQRWLNLQTNPNAFRYKLNVQRQKVLHGKLNIFVQVKEFFFASNPRFFFVPFKKIEVFFLQKTKITIQLKLLSCSFFPLQLNTERSSMRRPPQIITSIAQPFNGNAFNFNNVQECEILFHCHDELITENGRTTFLINNSPLTKYHSLICPRLKENLPQILTKECIELAIDILMGLNNRSYRIGYNSLGAFSSVNHLHMHLICVEQKLFVEDAVNV